MMHPSILQRWPLFITFKIKKIEIFPRNLRLDRVNKGNLVIKFEWGSCMSSMPNLVYMLSPYHLILPPRKESQCRERTEAAPGKVEVLGCRSGAS